MTFLGRAREEHHCSLGVFLYIKHQDLHRMTMNAIDLNLEIRPVPAFYRSESSFGPNERIVGSIPFHVLADVRSL